MKTRYLLLCVLLIAVSAFMAGGNAGLAALAPGQPMNHAPPEIVYVEPNGWMVSVPLPTASVQPLASALTEFTLGFYPSYDTAYRQYVQDWFDAVYPAIVAVLGEPYKSGKVCFRALGDSSYDPTCTAGTIVGLYPDIPLPYDSANAADASWDHVMTHEVIHAHHSNVMPHYWVGNHGYGDWLEEGLTEASTELVAEYARAQNIRTMSSYGYDPTSITLDYDVYSLAGTEFWGGSPVPTRKINSLGTYRLAAGLFWLAATSQTAGDSVGARDWINYDWFRRLNEITYTWKRANPSTDMNLAQFYQFVDQVSPLLIDGQKLGDWMKAQPITSHDNPPGHYLGAFPSMPISPTYLELVAYTLDSDDPANESYYVGQVDGTYAVYDYQNQQVAGDAFSITTGRVFMPSPCPGGDGAYRVEVQADVGGTARAARTAYLCASQTITDAVSGVGLILTNADGSLYSGTAKSASGTFLINVGAGAILQPNEISLMPKTISVGFEPYTQGGMIMRPVTETIQVYLPVVYRNWAPGFDWYNLPVPFSRVMVVSNSD